MYSACKSKESLGASVAKKMCFQRSSERIKGEFKGQSHSSGGGGSGSVSGGNSGVVVVVVVVVVVAVCACVHLKRQAVLQ